MITHNERTLMKTRLTILMMGLAAILGAGVNNARAAVSFSAGIEINATADFYAPLAPQGTWVEVGTYGRCWRPQSVAVGWAPYTEGYWEWTDYGWYWVSDEPWGWA